MDAHKDLTRKLSELTGVRIGMDAYCYSADGTEKPYIEMTLDKETLEKCLSFKQIKTNDFLFKLKRGVQTFTNGDLAIKYYYTGNNEIDISEKIDTGTKKYGVICPLGKFYRCRYAGHNDLEYMLKQRGIISDYGCYDNFEREGWVKLTGAAMTTVEFIFSEKDEDIDYKTGKKTLNYSHTITQEQVNSIYTYIKGLGRELVNFNYYWYNIEDFLEIVHFENLSDFSNMYGIRRFDGEEEELRKQVSNE